MIDQEKTIFKGILPVFDGAKNLYTAEPLPIGKERVRPMFYLIIISSSDANFSHSSQDQITIDSPHWDDEQDSELFDVIVNWLYC